jgi:DNA primase
VCEGQIDTIRLHASGFPVAVASQGTAFTEEHVKALKRVAQQVSLVFDDDEAGRKAAVRTSRLFLAEGMPVKVVSLPDGDDPDSFLRAHPKEDFQRLLDSAESIVRFQIRTERAKERDPGSIEALSRITRSLLQTVASCGSAVIKASMLAEAAKLLGLPLTALTEEFEGANFRPPVKKSAAAAVPEAEIPPPAAQEMEAGGDAPEFRQASKAEPPPELEFAFSSFLMENERDSVLRAMAGEFLPREVFSHPFTWRFTETWLAEADAEEDLFAGMREELDRDEASWLDRIFADGAAGRTRQSGESEAHILEDFIRRLWIGRLKRQQGELPAAGNPETEAKRFEISYNIRRFRDLRWNQVKELIREIMKGDN